jgi:hypothetical protein
MRTLYLLKVLRFHAQWGALLYAWSERAQTANAAIESS